MPPHPPRPRNAATTREAILRSAIQHFAEAGYDGAGVRDIAVHAGVTAMLVNRYFGSKEQLFAEAVETSFAVPAIIAEGPTALAHDAAAALAARTTPQAEPLVPFLIMLRSVSNRAAVEIIRAAIERHVGRRLAGQLAGDGRELRADVMLAVVSGVLLLRTVIGTHALADADSEHLERILETVFAAIIDDH